MHLHRRMVVLPLPLLRRMHAVGRLGGVVHGVLRMLSVALATTRSASGLALFWGRAVARPVRRQVLLMLLLLLLHVRRRVHVMVRRGLHVHHVRWRRVIARMRLHVRRHPLLALLLLLLLCERQELRGGNHGRTGVWWRRPMIRALMHPRVRHVSPRPRHRVAMHTSSALLLLLLGLLMRRRRRGVKMSPRRGGSVVSVHRREVIRTPGLRWRAPRHHVLG